MVSLILRNRSLEGLYRLSRRRGISSDVCSRRGFQLVKHDTIAGLRRAGLQFYRRRIQDREQSRKIRESALYSIKETEPLMPLTKHKSSFMHYCCSTCTPVSKVSFCYQVHCVCDPSFSTRRVDHRTDHASYVCSPSI